MVLCYSPEVQNKSCKNLRKISISWYSYSPTLVEKKIIIQPIFSNQLKAAGNALIKYLQMRSNLSPMQINEAYVSDWTRKYCQYDPSIWIAN